MEEVGAGQFRAWSARRRVEVGSVGVGGAVDEDVVGVVEKRVKAAWMADSVLALMRFCLARAEAFGVGLMVVEGREGRARLGFRWEENGLASGFELKKVVVNRGRVPLGYT